MERQRIVHLTAKDFEVQTFRSGGKGGQNQNKTESGVRIIHPPSGAIGESREERSQMQNKKIAFKRLTNTDKFQKWLHLEHCRKCGTIPSEREMERQVDEMISRDLENGNIKIEEIEEKKNA